MHPADIALYPIAALQCYLALRGFEEDNLFVHQNGDLLNKYQFWALTKQTLEHLGLSRFQFGTCSFRNGAASKAAAMGSLATDIWHLGRWISSCFRSYVYRCKA